MKKFFIFALIILCSMTCGCNRLTRTYGGDSTIKLEKNRKLMNATWKNDSLWILTREMREGENPETYIYKEDSNWGVLEGTITIVEAK